MSFSANQNEQLKAPLSKANVRSRQQGGRGVSYIEGWKAIDEANRIFGFDGWTRETIEIKCVAEREREIGQQKKPGWGVSYIAKVKVVAFAGDSIVTREGVGAGHGIDVDLGQAHESAIKEAETDAMKRALMTFGNPFGLALYDKEQANVVEPEDEMATRFKMLAGTKIAEFKDARELSDWWNSDAQKTARRNSGITQADADELKTNVMDRMSALKGSKAA
jgi:DNA recombination protein Rad52